MRFSRPTLLAIAAAGLLTAPGAAANTPAARLASMSAAIRAHHSVHYVSVQKSGNVTLTIECNAGSTSGIQRITYRKAGTSGRLTVIVAKRTAYVRGDAFALREFMGFSAAAATKLANAWLLVPSSSKAYPTVAEDVTYASSVGELKPAGKLANVGRRMLDGASVVGVRGTSTRQGQRVSTRCGSPPRGRLCR